MAVYQIIQKFIIRLIHLYQVIQIYDLRTILLTIINFLISLIQISNFRNPFYSMEDFSYLILKEQIILII
jgi:hypothetical protein